MGDHDDFSYITIDAPSATYPRTGRGQATVDMMRMGKDDDGKPAGGLRYVSGMNQGAGVAGQSGAAAY